MKSTTRLRGGALLGVAVLAAGLALPTPAFAAEVVKDDPITLETGHIDAFNLVLNDDKSVRLVLKEDVTGSHVLRTPESVELFVKSDAFATGLPAAALPAGSPTELYYLPLTQDHNLIWPGWDTQSVQSEYPGAKAEIDIAVDGPGDIYLWTQGSWGSVASLLVNGGYKLPGAIDQPYPAHTHANWGFSKPGTYTLTVKARVENSDSSRQTISNTAKYTIVVAPAPTSVAVTGAENPVAAGTQVTLKAAQTPADSTFGTYAWETRSSASGSWAPVAGATGPSLTVDAVDGAQYRASVSGGKDYSSGNAQPVTVVSAPATITLRSENPDPGNSTLEITGLSDHYHSGSPIELEAAADPSVEGATYEWYVQRSDQSSAVLQPGATGSTLKLTAEQAYTDAKVTAKLLGADGAVIATAPAVTLEVDDHGAAPLQKISVEGLSDHYHSDSTATLTAKVDPASVLQRYEWYVQKKGDAAPVLVEGENGESYSFPVAKELAEATVTAKLTYDNGNAYIESAPVTIEVDDHDDHGEEPAELSVAISSDRAADDYWVGQTARLTAEITGETDADEYRWLVKEPGAADFVAVEETGEKYSFKPTLANSGVQVKVELIHGDHVEAESEPVTITAQQRPVATTLTVTADKATCEPGDTVQLKSTQDPQTDSTHFHWYIKRAGDTEFAWVDQSREQDLALPVTLEDDGAQLVLRLFDETHAVIAESEPYTLAVKVAEEPQPQQKPATAPAAQDGSALDAVRAGGIAVSNKAPKAGEQITVQVGEGAEYANAWVAPWLFSEPTLLGGDWAQVGAEGSITVTVPAGTENGVHRLAVFDAEGALIGWDQIELAADVPGTDEPGTDTPGTDTPGTDTPGTDTPGTDTPGTDTPGTDTPGTDTPGADQPGTDKPGEKPGATDPGKADPVKTDPAKTDPKGNLAVTGGGDVSAYVIAASVMLLLGAATVAVSRHRRTRGEAEAE